MGVNLEVYFVLSCFNIVLYLGIWKLYLVISNNNWGWLGFCFNFFWVILIVVG